MLLGLCEREDTNGKEEFTGIKIESIGTYRQAENWAIILWPKEGIEIDWEEADW